MYVCFCNHLFYYLDDHYLDIHYLDDHYLDIHYLDHHYLDIHYLDHHYLDNHLINDHYLDIHYLDHHYLDNHYLDDHYLDNHLINDFLSYFMTVMKMLRNLMVFSMCLYDVYDVFSFICFYNLKLTFLSLIRLLF